MTKKKAPNWEDIKTRYIVNGEKPGDIAKAYNVSAKTISNRASEEGWREESGKIGKEIRVEAIDNRKRILAKIEAAYEYMVDNIIQELPNMGALVHDGEKFPNKYHLKTWEMGLASYLKPVEEDPDKDSKETGFIGLPGVDVNSI